MRKIKEILRLHFEQKLGQRQIARSVNISQSTVHEYLARAKEAGIRWPLGQEWDEARLESALFPPGPPSEPSLPAQSVTSVCFCVLGGVAGEGKEHQNRDGF